MHVVKPCTWWRHQMETFSALLAICAGNSPVPGEFPTQRPVTRSFDVLFDLRLNKRLSNQSCGWWFETPSCSLWRHRNEFSSKWPSQNSCIYVEIMHYDCNLSWGNVVINGGTGGCHNDNLRCRHWRQSCHPSCEFWVFSFEFRVEHIPALCQRIHCWGSLVRRKCILRR